MPPILNQDIRERVRTTISKRAPQNTTKQIKLENIENFNNLSREGLENGNIERRILLYETHSHEKVYMQYPGIESKRNGQRNFMLDARPIIQKSDGEIVPDMNFGRIWDMIDRIGQGHQANLDVLAVLFLRIAYMIGYQHNDTEYLSETINVITGEVIESSMTRFCWNSLILDPDVVETLGDSFGLLGGVSLEGFLYYNDLLAQNEDCKYSYLKGQQWDFKSGRINNCLSHLTVIAHMQGHMGISELINKFQHGGVAPLAQNKFNEVCGDLVIQE